MSDDIRREFEKLSGQEMPDQLNKRRSEDPYYIGGCIFMLGVVLVLMGVVGVGLFWRPVARGNYFVCQSAIGQKEITKVVDPDFWNLCFGKGTYFTQKPWKLKPLVQPIDPGEETSL